MKKRLRHILLKSDVLDAAGTRAKDVVNFLLSALDNYCDEFAKEDIRLRVNSFDGTVELYGLRPETDEEYNERLELEEKSAAQLKKPRHQLYEELKQEFYVALCQYISKP